jgi:hypothetical protein
VFLIWPEQMFDYLPLWVFTGSLLHFPTNQILKVKACRKFQPVSSFAMVMRTFMYLRNKYRTNCNFKLIICLVSVAGSNEQNEKTRRRLAIHKLWKREALIYSSFTQVSIISMIVAWLIELRPIKQATKPKFFLNIYFFYFGYTVSAISLYTYFYCVLKLRLAEKNYILAMAIALVWDI